MKVNATVTNNVDTQKVKQAVEKSKITSLSHATNYVKKTIHNSIKKRRGTVKRYKLNIYDRYANVPVMSVSQYLSRHDHSGDKIVIYSNPGTGKKKKQDNVREMEKTGTRIEKTKSAAGAVPYSFPRDPTVKHYRANFPNYWLRNSIRSSPKEGLVYSNPEFAAKTLPIPQILEYGGMSSAHHRHHIGYRVIERDYRHGQKHITFQKVYSPAMGQVRVGARPFMRPGVEQAKSHLPKIYADQISVLMR
jgi:hypothetical protein